MNKNMPDFVIVSGFYATGASAVIDYLKEFKCCVECGKEIRFIRDPYGITDLERSIVDNWDLINSTVAIEDFLHFSKICARYGDSPLSRPGLSYSKYINKNYWKITNKYVEKLTKYTYKAEYYATKFKKRYLSYVIDRNLAYIERRSKGKLKVANTKNKIRYFAVPTKDEFDKATLEYIEELFRPLMFSSDGERKMLILDQALSPNNAEPLNRYFKNAKFIIVDRDPRDVYCQNLKINGYRLKNPSSKEAGEMFAERYKAMRRNLKLNNENIYYLKFEDLILNYETTTKKIKSFLNLDESEHIYPFKFLKPQISIKNIGVWKNNIDMYRDAFAVMEQNLSEYCYHEKR